MASIVAHSRPMANGSGLQAMACKGARATLKRIGWPRAFQAELGGVLGASLPAMAGSVDFAVGMATGGPNGRAGSVAGAGSMPLSGSVARSRTRVAQPVSALQAQSVEPGAALRAAMDEGAAAQSALAAPAGR